MCFFCCFFSPPPASGLVRQFETILLLRAQDRTRRSGQNAVLPLRKDELLGDELPRGFAHDQLRRGALAPVPPSPDLRPLRQLHVPCQRDHESHGPLLQKDVEGRFAAEGRLACTDFTSPPLEKCSGRVFSFTLVLRSIRGERTWCNFI